MRTVLWNAGLSELQNVQSPATMALKDCIMSPEEKRAVPAEGSNRGHEKPTATRSNVSDTMSGQPPAFAAEESFGRDVRDKPAADVDRTGEDDTEAEHPTRPSGRSCDS
jgi:hypothetical protein